MPTVIRALFLVDIGLALAYLVWFSIGHPSSTISDLLDLNEERNIPTWYASMQLFLAALLLGIVASRVIDPRRARTWLVALVPVVIGLMSMEEVATFHERVGELLDVLLPAHSRAGTAVSQTGLWVAIIGIPAMVIIAIVLRLVLPVLPTRRGSVLLAIGLTLLLLGAVGIETLANLVAPESFGAIVQVSVEEFLEFAGATLIVWGSLDMVLRVGFHLAEPVPGEVWTGARAPVVPAHAGTRHTRPAPAARCQDDRSTRSS